MPSLVRVGRRLAVLYDAPGGTSVTHMKRDIGLAWLNLPRIRPSLPSRALTNALAARIFIVDTFRRRIERTRAKMGQ